MCSFYSLSLSPLSSSQSSNKHPVGGTWTLLYSSSRDGLSFTRFMSQSSDYRDPSILLLTCRDGTVGEVRQFVVGVDKEWRDGTHYWGEDNSFLLELEPSFTLLKSRKRERRDCVYPICYASDRAHSYKYNVT